MSRKGRYCNMFNSEAGCPFGDNCKYLHRERVVISLGPRGSHGVYASDVSSNSKSYKTKPCLKFEATGFCPFGAQCRFAHGSQELVSYEGILGPAPEIGRVVPTAPINNRPLSVGTPSRPLMQNSTIGFAPVIPQLGSYPIGVPPKRFSIPPFPRLKPRHLRKDCNLIRQTYADWIDEME